MNLLRVENCVENDSRCWWKPCEPDARVPVCIDCDESGISLGRVRCSDPVRVERREGQDAETRICAIQPRSELRSRNLD